MHRPGLLFGAIGPLVTGSLCAAFAASPDPPAAAGPIRVGIIGLDTSHAIAFTKLLNDPAAPPELAGCPVVAAYPQGSRDIESSVSRVPAYTEEIEKLRVKIVGSIDELLAQVDAVLLETNDGRPHLEQVRPVFAAGKPVFIDKPVAGSLADAVTIYREAVLAGVPVFSSSALRYGATTQQVRAGSLGRVRSCETTSPASLEPSHPDLFWYGIHGVESLFTVLGTGCLSVRRTAEDGAIVVHGTWSDGRTGTFREAKGYGGTARGQKGEAAVGAYDGYRPLVVEIVKFFRTGAAPVTPEETLEIYAFMEAADESQRQGGAEVTLASVMQKAAGFAPLFNGTDLTGWKGLVDNPKPRKAMSAAALSAAQSEADASMREHWSVVDRVLRFDGKAQSLCIAKDYGDFVARRRGHFGFAAHGDPVAFRNVMIRELPGAPAAPPARGAARTPVDGPVKRFNGGSLEHVSVWHRETKSTDSKKVFSVSDGMLRVSGAGTAHRRPPFRKRALHHRGIRPP